MKYRYFIWLLTVFLFLFVGALLYLQGTKEVIVLGWLEVTAPMVYACLMWLAKVSPNIYAPGWVAHHLADIMWSTSFAMLICGIWVKQFTTLKLLPLGITCAIFYEVLQLVGVASGTFDIWDLVYSFGAGGLAAVFTSWLLRGKPNQE